MQSSYSAYKAARQAGGGAPQPAPPHGSEGFGGGEETRDPEPTVSSAGPAAQAIHKAESFAEYLAKRGNSAVVSSPATPPPPPITPSPEIQSPVARSPAALPPPEGSPMEVEVSELGYELRLPGIVYADAGGRALTSDKVRHAAELIVTRVGLAATTGYVTAATNAAKLLSA